MTQNERNKKYLRSAKGKAAQKTWRQGPGRESSNEVVRRHALRRKAWIDAFKLSKGCFDCGYKAHPEALEFDHVRGVKCFELGTRKRLAMERVMAEIEKCDVVCANCHRVRTYDRRAAANNV